MRLASTAVLGTALVLCSCQREQRDFSDVAASARRPAPPPETPNAPGPATPPRDRTAPPPISPRVESDPRNAWAVSDGMRLFRWFNCSGCHATGGRGPSLADQSWIYGGDPDDIYHSISRGRPNGMPAFGGRIPEQQLWHLVAYVRALSAKVPLDVRPGRADSMAAEPPESLRSPEPPRPPAVGGPRR